MIVLIDGDLVAFRCAASAENDGVEIAILRTDKLIRQLIEETKADSYRVFLTGPDNFRKTIDPEYKANRTEEPPQYLNDCKEYLILEHKAEIEESLEADDLLAINQSEETIIASLDKDLLQIPGRHYQWEIRGTSHGKQWTKEAAFYDVEELEGLRSFYVSSLVGDRSDNIFGVEGLGKVKAAKALQHCESEQELFDTCRTLYKDDTRFFKNLKLLWLLREYEDVFDPEKRGLINGTISTK
jgi:DNA polymerase-1